MIPLAFVVGVAAATLIVLVVAVVALAKQASRLARTLQAFERETRPILEEIQQGADQASARMGRLPPAGVDAMPDAGAGPPG